MSNTKASMHPPNKSALGPPIPPGPRRVLVVDDDDVARETMVDLLKTAGHDVISLPSPIGATKAIINSKINVVVLDVVMPSLRGDKLAILLGRNPRLRHVGVVLVTGASTTELASMASKVGAAAIVQKSNMHTQLDKAVRRAGHVA